jgi:branched-chain amino acid aminotransferase
MSNEIAVWQMKSGRAESLQKVLIHSKPTSLDEATRLLPGGAYTTFRTFGRYGVLRPADHYHRLEETACLSGKMIGLNRWAVTQVLHQALTDYPESPSRVRIILDLVQDIGDIYILIEALHLPSQQDYIQGVKVVTRRMQRQNAKAKITEFIQTADSVRQMIPAEINEVVMIGEDGLVLEGLSSNFFGVVGGKVWTEEKGVLSGITRSFVLEGIREWGIPVELQGIPVKELGGLDEAFLTSASRAVLPVTMIDGKPVGSGRPGPITLRLMESYREKVEKEVELI